MGIMSDEEQAQRSSEPDNTEANGVTEPVGDGDREKNGVAAEVDPEALSSDDKGSYMYICITGILH